MAKVESNNKNLVADLGKEEKKAGGPVTEESIVEAIQKTVCLLNGQIEQASQIAIRVELDSVDVTTCRNRVIVIKYNVKLSKILS